MDDRSASHIEMQLKRIADALEALARKHGEHPPQPGTRPQDLPPMPKRDK